MNPLVLVTGGTGFIGGTLLRMAAEGVWSEYSFTTLGSRPVGDFPFVDARRDSEGRYTFKAADFTSAGVPSVDFLVHLGAFIPKCEKEANDVAGAIANVANLPRLFRNLPSAPRRIVFASSIDVYAPARDKIGEGAACAPATLYGQSKLFGESIAAELVRSMPGTELQVLRLGHTYGPGEEEFQKFIPNAIRKLKSRWAMDFHATGQERRAFLYSEDCCRLIMAALAREAVQGPINVASPRARRLSEVAELLATIHEEATGVRPPVRWSDGIPPELEVVPDTARMAALGDIALTPLEEGLRREYLAIGGTSA